jgi:peptide/nickel transport system substrate-binding protein
MKIPSCTAVALLFFAPGCGERADSGNEDRLIVAYPYGLASVEPERAYEELSMSILSNVYETLVEVRPGVGLSPQLAESWHNPDERTWVFHIRPGVRLHDGRMLSGQHVAAALERARTDPASARRADLATVVSIEAVGTSTVVLTTGEPDATLAARLSHVLLGVPASSLGQRAVGTGAFRLRSWTHGESTILESFPSHREGAPRIARLEFHAVPAARERVRRLSDGRIDLMLDVPVPDFVRLSSDPRIETAAREGKRVLFLGMDTRRGPFRDLRVRRAAALAVDRAALVSGPLGGFGAAASQLVTADVMGFDPDVRPSPFDPERARRLLAEAGYPHGFATQLDYIRGKYRGMDAIIGMLVTQLGAVGIQLEPRPQSVPEFVRRLTTMDTPFFLAGVLNDTGDAGGSYQYLLHTPDDGLGWLNGGDYSDETVDVALREAARLERADERARALARVAQRVATEVPVIPLVVAADLYAFRSGLEFRPEPSRRIRAASVQWRPRETDFGGILGRWVPIFNRKTADGRTGCALLESRFCCC